MYIPDRKSLSIILKVPESYERWVQDYLDDIQKQQKIKKKEVALFHRFDPFDSEVFGLKVGKVEDVIGQDKNAIFSVVNKFFQSHPYDYCSIRLSQHFIDWIHAFQQQGSHFLDTTVEMVCDLRKMRLNANSKFVTEEINEEIAKQTVEVAKSFEHGRFFTDPYLKKGEEIYRRWIQNSIDKKAADRIFVLQEDGQVHGFTTIKKNNLGNLNGWKVQLVGKHENSQRPKVAETLLNHVLTEAKQDGIDYVLIATQATNIPAQRAYQYSGFMPYASGVTLGWKKL